MKKMTENFKNFLFVIVLLGFASNIFAHDSKPNLKITNSEKKIFTLVTDNAKSTSVTIRIFDAQGINLLKEEIALGGRHSKSYDLSKLPNGTYELEIETFSSFRIYIVTITSNNLEIVENREERIYKPFVKLEGSNLSFNILNLNSKDVSLVINNVSGDEIYFEKIKDTQTIHKSYDLSNLPSGVYLITVKNSAKVFNVEVDLI